MACLFMDDTVLCRNDWLAKNSSSMQMSRLD